MSIAVNVLLDLGLIALLAYVMSAPARLRPHGASAGELAAPLNAAPEPAPSQRPLAALEPAA